MALNFVGYTFTKHWDNECLSGQNLYVMTISYGDNESCKEWCTNNTDCGEFMDRYGWCDFKGLACKDNVYRRSIMLLFLKEMV